MNDTTPIHYADQPAIDAIRRRYHHTTASHAFASLWIWQWDMQLSLLQGEDFFAVKSGLHGENSWFFPCGNREEVLAFLQEGLQTPGFSLCYLRAEDAALLEAAFPEKFAIEAAPDDDEYLYDVAEQVALSGKKFAHLRNHIRRANADHVLSSSRLYSENFAAAAEIVAVWEQKNTETSALGLTDRYAAAELFRHAKPLGVQGVLVYVDGEPYAVTAGYPLSDDTFDLCLAKQRDTLPGLSVFAKHELFAALAGSYATVNAEEDLGIAGLRTMKRQMQPSGRIVMYRATALHP